MGEQRQEEFGFHTRGGCMIILAMHALRTRMQGVHLYGAVRPGHDT